MNKLIAIAAVSLLPFGSAFAAQDIGCGLGTQLMKDQNGLIFRVLGATTNGFFGNQTFGITSGTLGCAKNGVVAENARRSMFAATNVDQLSAEIAAGEGETLATLAALYKVDAADVAAFYALAQSQYATLFPNAEVTTGEVLARLETVMANDARLARYVA
ncbi:MAG: DUF3015 domain-containing protein [Nevskia sp.]|nr:DUF3015 domain-containing protein [Nevskia sp.]